MFVVSALRRLGRHLRHHFLQFLFRDLQRLLQLNEQRLAHLVQKTFVVGIRPQHVHPYGNVRKVIGCLKRGFQDQFRWHTFRHFLVYLQQNGHGHVRHGFRYRLLARQALQLVRHLVARLDAALYLLVAEDDGHNAGHQSVVLLLQVGGRLPLVLGIRVQRARAVVLLIGGISSPGGGIAPGAAAAAAPGRCAGPPSA